jgi:hypothetical protein
MSFSTNAFFWRSISAFVCVASVFGFMYKITLCVMAHRISAKKQAGISPRSLSYQINKKSPFPSGKGLTGRFVPMGISHIRLKIILHAVFISVK